MIPDFVQLGRETFWSAEDWLRAWNILPSPQYWPVVVELCRATAQNPVACAGRLIVLLHG